MPTYTPRHPPPDPEIWDRFCDEVDIASQMLAAGAPAQPPVEALSSAQYACGKYFAAMDELLRALGAPREVRDLVKVPAGALHRAAWGLPDPFLAIASDGSGRPAASVQMTVFRALVVKVSEEEAKGGDTDSLRVAARTVASALRKAQAPKGCIPTGKTIQNWHGEAGNPKTATERHLANAVAHFRGRPWLETAGGSLVEKVTWIVAGYRATKP